jgi:hypothetical protein
VGESETLIKIRFFCGSNPFANLNLNLNPVMNPDTLKNLDPVMNPDPATSPNLDTNPDDVITSVEAPDLYS